MKESDLTFLEKSKMIGEEWRNLNKENIKTTKASFAFHYDVVPYLQFSEEESHS